VLRNHHVLDVMVHIDPEDDMLAKPNVNLPPRDVLLAHLAGRLGTDFSFDNDRIVLHYLSGKVDAELLLEHDCLPESSALSAFQQKCAAISADDRYFRSIHLYRQCAPK
jgi:hypothetical protein